MKSSAVTGTPSDHTALGLMTYWMVSGDVDVASTLSSRSVLTWGTSFGLIDVGAGQHLGQQCRRGRRRAGRACWG